MATHQIRYFLAVAKTLNFTQAAEECHVAQPSLSRAIRNLEEELGGELFRRERALSHLTELGKLMLPLRRCGRGWRPLCRCRPPRARREAAPRPQPS